MWTRFAMLGDFHNGFSSIFDFERVATCKTGTSSCVFLNAFGSSN